MVTKYGIISDIHRCRPGDIFGAVEYFADKNIDTVVLNGDVIGDQAGIPLHNFGELVSLLGFSKLETYIMPGSHETIRLAATYINGFSAGEMEYIVKRYEGGNLHFVDGILKVERDDHDAIFMPGSDWRAGDATYNGFALERGDFETGRHEVGRGIDLQKINMNDLTDYVKRPDETVLFSHIPRKFDNIDTGVDRAYFAESLRGDGLMPGIVLELMIVQRKGPLSKEDMQKFASIYGYELKNENRGNEDLKEILEDLNINKHVTGHFHESAHRAHDAECNPVEEGKSVDELFRNASYADEFKFGVLTVKGPKVTYENIRLSRF